VCHPSLAYRMQERDGDATNVAHTNEYSGVINFASKKIGPFMSEFLTTGFKDKEGNIILVIPEFNVPNCEKLL